MKTRLPRPDLFRASHGVDAVLALAAGLFVLVGVCTDPEPRAPSPLGTALVLACCGSLLWRRRHPVAVVAVTGIASTLLYNVGSEPDAPYFVAPLVALYTVAAEGRMLVAAATVALTALALTAKQVLAGPGEAVGENAALVTGWLLAVLAAGAVSRARRRYLAEVEQRAADAERTREAEGRRRATEERIRIARELHDVLTHNISLINVQSGAALYTLTAHPERTAEAVEALGVIRDAGKDAMRELRATLGVLRHADAGGGAGGGPAEPAPGLGRLNALVDSAGRAGLAVDTAVEGAPGRIPAAVDLAAFRIVQEALTNVARHADVKLARVRIRYGAEDVVVQVDDEGRSARRAARAGGHGIQGMRERALALGGDLHAGPRVEGGFQVRARLPLREDA